MASPTPTPPVPTPTPTGPPPSTNPNPPIQTPAPPQPNYPPIPQLPNVPSNAYQLLLDLSSAIDTAASNFRTSHSNLQNMQNTANTAVGGIVANSEGEATTGLNDIWYYSQKDFSNATTPLESISSAAALGGLQNQLQVVLEQHKADFANGIPALGQLDHYVQTNFASSPTVAEVDNLLFLVTDGLQNALGNVNMALWMMITAISNINSGISYACSTGLVPGQPIPTFHVQSFTMESNGGSGGGSDTGKTADDWAQQWIKQGVDPNTAQYLALFAEEQGLNLAQIDALLQQMSHYDGGQISEMDYNQLQTWLEDGTLANWKWGVQSGRSLDDVTNLVNQGVDYTTLTNLMNSGADLNQIASDLSWLSKQPIKPGESITTGEMATWLSTLNADQLATMRNRIAQSPKIPLSDVQQLVDPQLKWQANPKHDVLFDGIGGQPANPTALLDNSVSIKEATTTRRVAIDPTTGEIAIFDDTNDGTIHGHVRTWSELTIDMQHALINDGLITDKGWTIVRDAQGNIEAGAGIRIPGYQRP